MMTSPQLPFHQAMMLSRRVAARLSDDDFFAGAEVDAGRGGVCWCRAPLQVIEGRVGGRGGVGGGQGDVVAEIVGLMFISPQFGVALYASTASAGT